MVLAATRLGARILGRTRRVDVLIYKADRLGDWLLAEPSIQCIVLEARAQGRSVAIWAATEGAAYRAWRPVAIPVEEFPLEPRGWAAKAARALAVVRLLAVYRAKRFICLRHTPEPVRDFILAQVDAEEIYALSRHLIAGLTDAAPNEFHRHLAILRASGHPVENTNQLLPTLPRPTGEPNRRVVLAPFSSSAIKDWPPHAWSRLIGGLADRGFHFEIWVGSGQIPRAQALIREIRAQAPSSELAAKSGSLAELAQAVGTATLIVTVDTFSAHLAVAMDAPVVCLVGGGHYGDFGPWYKSLKQRWITNFLPCFGCNWICVRSRPECIEDIEPEAVIAEIEAVLALGAQL